MAAGGQAGSTAPAACAELRGQLAAAVADIGKLKGQLRELRRDRFGRKSEALGTGPAADPGPHPPAGTRLRREAGKKKRRRGRQPGAPTPPRVDRSHLPVETESADPPEEECACPQCGKACQSRGSEPSETIGIRIPAYRRELLRKRCRPDCDCEEAREAIAEPPPRPADGSPPGVSVQAWFPVQACERFRPQAAAVRELGSRGLPVPVATVSRNLRGPSALFAPLGEKIPKRMEGAAVARADETSWSVQVPDGDGGRERRWLRGVPGRGRGVHAHSGRTQRGGGREAAGRLRARRSACKALARALAGRIVLAFCRARQRRDFRRVGISFPELEDWADSWLERIGELFALNRRRREAWRPGLPAERQSAEFRALQRQLESALEALFRQAREEGRLVASEWQLAEALEDGPALARADAKGAVPGSLPKHREGMEVFAGDPRVPMDSNAAERALRGPVIGRLTSFGSGSEDGAEATALYDSVHATLREQGVNPNAWTRDFLEACARNGHAGNPGSMAAVEDGSGAPARSAPGPGTGATGASAENPGAASQPLARAAWRDLTGHCQRLAKPLCPRPFHGRLECLPPQHRPDRVEIGSLI